MLSYANTETPTMNHTNSAQQRKNIFIDNSKLAHGDKYDYSKVVYTNAREKVEIICKEHGSFWQIPDTHSRGVKCGCPTCGKEKSKPTKFCVRLTTGQFLEQCVDHHGDFYDYSKTEYTGKTNLVTITCPDHGDFIQKAENHKNGAGCPSCGTIRAHTSFKATTEEFIEKSRKVHGDLYTYLNTTYTGNKNPVTITCKEHGDFTIGMAGYHYIGSKIGCPKCSTGGISLQERSLATFVESLGLTVVTGDRSIIKPLELDMVIPELKIAIEYNGLYWHSEQMGKDKYYHLNKTLATEKAGYRLIQIFEDEWTLKQDIVKSRLRHIFGKDTQKRLFARKLTVKRITNKDANTFFLTYHIQGSCAARLAYGLFDGEELVAAISFGTNRFSKEKEMELIRFSTSHNVVGGFSKLLTHFKRENPEIKSLTSYSDRRWSVGNVYDKNGFTFAGSSQPGYFYSNSEGRRINRVVFQKHKLSKALNVFNESLTEVQNVIANGYTRIFDCGMDKWTMIL